MDILNIRKGQHYSGFCALRTMPGLGEYTEQGIRCSEIRDSPYFEQLSQSIKEKNGLSLLILQFIDLFKCPSWIAYTEMCYENVIIKRILASQKRRIKYRRTSCSRPIENVKGNSRGIFKVIFQNFLFIFGKRQSQSRLSVILTEFSWVCLHHEISQAVCFLFFVVLRT